jgi:hypothetical protein
MAAEAGFDMSSFIARTVTSLELHHAASEPPRGRIWRQLENRLRYPLEVFRAMRSAGRR